MKKLDLDTLTAACRPGGASVLTTTTDLAPAAGPHAGVAPARYVRGREATYSFETRYVDLDGAGPRAVSTVLLDSKGSSLNRVEAAVSQAIADGDELLCRTPRIRVTYRGMPPVSCLDLPHRAFDGHARSGTIDGRPATDDDTYRAARDSTSANARALLETSPISIVLGSWDSTRRSNQVRFRSALVGEVIGVLADQGPNSMAIAPRGAARFDQIAPSVRLSADDLEALVAAQEHELSTKNAETIRKEIKRVSKNGTTSAAKLGLGSVPPSLTGLGLVSCRRIIRTHVLSFSALRQVRFGLGPEGDAAARALLAALALAGLTRSYDELLLRANCDLVETGEPKFVLDGRYGSQRSLSPLKTEEAGALLASAVDAAVAAGIRWEGQILDVAGNPVIAGGIEADAEGEAE